jgi:hypothetical protein
MRTFANAHRKQSVKSPSKRARYQRPKFGAACIVNSQDTWSGQYRLQRNRTDDVEFVLKSPRFAQELRSPTPVDQRRRRSQSAFDGNRDLHLSARDSLQNLLAHSRLDPRKLASGHHGNFTLPAIDRKALGHDAEAVRGCSAAPMAGHALHWRK